MMRGLPPLSSLRAFEAAARLQNFSRAAEELHVTPGAVSHRIKALEAFLGAALFVRHGKRSLVLTGEGRDFAEQVRGALQQVADAARRIQRQRPERLVISTLPSFASRWLMPRIGSFLDAHPGIDFGLRTGSAHVDFAAEGVDLAIRFGPGGWPNVDSELLMRDEQFPVCSPAFLDARPPLGPQDLCALPLLQADPPGWRPWFEAAGLGPLEPRPALAFNDAALTLQAAIDGRGVMLARRSIVERDLAAGVLVRPFATAVATDYAYYLVWPRQVSRSELAAEFRAWLLAHAGAVV